MNLSDAEPEPGDLYFSRLDFSSLTASIYSAYTLATLQNALGLFAFVARVHPWYLPLLVPIFCALVIGLQTFIIALLNFYYARVIRAQVRALDHWPAVREVLERCQGHRGLVDHVKVEELLAEFLRNPQSPDLDLPEAVRRKAAERDRAERRALRSSTCEFNR